MGGIETLILSPILGAFFKEMASGKFNNFFLHRKQSEGLLKKLKTEFLIVNAVIEDAEELVVTKPAVKDWLDDLKDVVYDAEQVLDEIATEVQQNELDAESPPLSMRKVRKSIPFLHNPSVKRVEEKIQELLERLARLIDSKNAIGLKEGVGGKPSDRITTSLVEESGICGRDNEKEEIIKMLLSDDACDNEMGVVAIIGMGGLGKTTLAQLVYNDERVKQHFKFHAWVCVSDQFDLVTITKTILKRLAPSSSDNNDLDQLQSTLKGKKFLFVLDDVWNENYVKWENLCKSFKSRVKGSRIIVTTRNDSVASTMRVSSSSICRLKQLGDNDCWSLFTKHAFIDYNSKANSQLEDWGKQIVKKCGGVPLAIKTIGALLRSKSYVEWNKILKSELWDLPSNEIDIIPALKLSYKYLSSYVKRCFAYCAIFPKDYTFEKDSLILLWMGEGFLHESGSKTIEEVDDDYFSTLVSRSLFQQSSDNISSFIMHDLVNDLATFVSGQFMLRLDDNYSDEKLNKVRHLSYGREWFEGFKKFEFLSKTKKLHTFLPLDLSKRFRCRMTKRIVLELLPMLKCLRVLSLSKYVNISELPDSIGKIKHLRYLDLSSTKLQKLPDSICELCNLQVLNLSKCRGLVALPGEMWKLINLRHLYVTETGIKDMPMQLGKLKCLKTLTHFVIGKGDGCCIAELGNLPNLQGSLDIVGIQNVKSPTAALDARMRDKKCLNELKLEWKFNRDIDNSRDQMVLDNLQPNTNLKGFHICSYRGKHLSNWLGNPSSELVSVKLENCKNCESLPPLGQLPSLEILSIIGFDGVVSIGREFYCTNSSSVTPFKALKNLSLVQMEKWEEWVLFEAENGVGAFPQLERLYIGNCPKLIRGLPGHLPSLVELEIKECPQLVASFPRATILHKLVLSKCKVLLEDLPTGLKILVTDGLDAEKFNDLPSSLEILNIKDCEKLEFLPEGMTKVKRLEIKGLDALESFSKDGFPSIEFLNIQGCGKLLSLPEAMIDSNNYLQKLCITGCSSLMSLSKDNLPSTLKELYIRRCGKLEFLAKRLTGCNNYLQKLCITGCSSLQSLPEYVLPSTLEELYIQDCGKLESLPKGMKEFNNCLQHLKIDDCFSLRFLPEDGFPSTLKTLKIARCKNLELPTNVEYPSLEYLCLWNCDSLSSVSFDSFPRLYEIDIRVCHKLESLTIPENLESSNLTSSSVGSPRSLPDEEHVLRSLEQLYLANCPKLVSVLEEGLLSNLKSIKIDYKIGARTRWRFLLKVPLLRDLRISGKFTDVQSFPIKQELPSGLIILQIISFPNLKTLDIVGLQHLNVLERLHIVDCPKLKIIPEQGLPASISVLKVCQCPLLKEQWQSRKGKDWKKIAAIEQKWIDFDLIE